MESIQAPGNRISKSYIRVQRIAGALWLAGEVFVLAIIYLLARNFHWYAWIDWFLYGLGAVSVLYAVWSIGLAPMLMQRYWRYDVGEEFIQLQHGRLIRSNQLIPLTKVQYVELGQGPLLRSQNLFRIEIGTMGSQHVIPGLSEQEAYRVRERIAELARIKEVEE
ncbi:PH domain-containing protein [Aciduricibacillus chroicocephali]|uniref:PH domain-containing protein n=1 Tax=Aciduricibacillus chroicocephali TaxID=3054939 RepID=A0ABY9KVU9_9BACI|nr:PH domain-containing protein [Bacillaceae bacterium 44XB]